MAKEPSVHVPLKHFVETHKNNNLTDHTFLLFLASSDQRKCDFLKLEDISPFGATVVPLFWTSGDVRSRFQSQGESLRFRASLPVFYAVFSSLRPSTNRASTTNIIV